MKGEAKHQQLILMLRKWNTALQELKGIQTPDGHGRTDLNHLAKGDNVLWQVWHEEMHKSETDFSKIISTPDFTFHSIISYAQ